MSTRPDNGGSWETQNGVVVERVLVKDEDREKTISCLFLFLIPQTPAKPKEQHILPKTRRIRGFMMDIDLAIQDALHSSLPLASGLDLHRELSRAQTDVAELGTQISELRSQTSQLEKQTDLLQSRCSNIQSLLSSPIRRLPPEILAVIFKCAIDLQPINSHSHRLPVRLTQTCRYWRQLAMSVSQLWSTITLWPSGDAQLARHQVILDHFLARSGTTPLSISIGLSEVADDWSMINTIVPHASRWQSISLRLRGSWFTLHPFIRIDDCTLGQLERVQFVFDTTPRTNPFALAFPRYVRCFLSAPILTSVTLNYAWPPNALPLPWAQLAHLTIGTAIMPTDIPIYDVFETLRLCTHLTSFTFTGNSDVLDEPILQHHPIVLPSLRSLCLGNAHRDDLLLSRLVVPELNQFSYNPFRDRRSSEEIYSLSSSLPAFQLCHAQSGCTITILSLNVRFA
ncbi:hypothetical protein JAAARDRAFT_204373 [Jaapia argillacea MUCL 33604]|uniref:F-box domain-containing protein n=1 Tax=Jaapia argillacea MUCL 33604 TaxID=933084 RepID=A0A067Q765_9AGAM|nr:hypothetical protein JAAARDRAFT_204373 [Jaapia argillacea MUCL 33604]